MEDDLKYAHIHHTIKTNKITSRTSHLFMVNNFDYLLI